MILKIAIIFVGLIINLHAQELFVKVDNAELFCKIMGQPHEQSSPLLVLHGGPGLSHDYLLPQMQKLADRHFVIFYDQRGCGQSLGVINENVINIDTYIQDLEKLRITLTKTFGYDKISILGHSWGGFVAMKYAIAYPEHVDHLILSNSTPATSFGFSLFMQEWVKRTNPISAQMQEIQNLKGFREDPELMERYNRLILRTYCYKAEKSELLNFQQSQQALIRGAKVYDLFKQNLFQSDYNLESLLDKLNVPTLVIHGDVDPIPPCTAQNIHQHIPGSQYILMHNCGHFPYVEDPDVYFQHILEFLE